MRRASIVAFALIGALLVVSAAPVSAAPAGGTLVVGSQHTTDADFNNAQKLDNLTVSDGFVNLATPFENFEDGDITISDSDWSGWSGNTGSFSAQQTTVLSGAYSGELQTSSGSFTQVTATRNSNTAKNLSYEIQVGASSSGESSTRIYAADGTNLGKLEFNANGSIYWNDGTSDNLVASYSADTPLEISLQWDWANNEVTVVVNGTTEGTFALRNSASGFAEVQFFTTMDSNADPVIDELSLGDSMDTQEALYISDTHSVTNAEQASINITQASNVSVEATVRTDGGTVLNQTTLTSTGNHSLTLASTSSDKLKTVLNVTVTGDNPQFELSDESILFDNSAPVIDNSTATPANGEELTTSSVNLSVDIADSNFGTAQGEELTATFSLDGQVVGSETLQSNGTASVTVDSVSPGSHTWSVTVSDSYGSTVSSKSFSFKTPNTLEIRSVTNPDSLVNTSGNVTVTFFSADGTTVVEKTATDGTVNFTDENFDPNKKFIVSAEVEGYHTRTIIIDSLYQQQSIYLLNKSVESVDVEFQIDDATGRFSGSSNTEIIIQRALTVNNTTKWRTVIGDEISASREAPTTLEKGARYRIIVRNSDESRVLGQYIASSNEANEVLPIGEIDIEGNVTRGVAFGGSLTDYNGTPTLRYIFRDVDDRVTELHVELRNESNGSTVIYEVTETDPQTTYAETVLLQNASMDAQYTLVWNATLADGSEVSDSIPLGGIPDIGCMGLGPTPCTMGGYLAILMTFGLVAIRRPSAGVGAATVVASALTLVGILSLHPAQLGLAGGLAIVMHWGGDI